VVPDALNHRTDYILRPCSWRARLAPNEKRGPFSVIRSWPLFHCCVQQNRVHLWSEQTENRSDMKTCTNILSRIRAEHVGDSKKALPDVYATTEEIMHSVIDVPEIGRVLFTHQRHKYKHQKSTNWFWNTATAVLLDNLFPSM
jgi:hypothetical protein